jgi:hypothetical protein
MLADVHRLLRLQLKPGDFAVYKARKGQGSALKLNLRLNPTFSDAAEAEYVAEVDGGLFVTLAPEGPEKNGFPTFQWQDASQCITGKLGMPDITGLLTAIREYRRSQELPVGLQREGPQGKLPNEFGGFHKTGDGSNTAYAYTFSPDGARFQISKTGKTEKAGKRLAVALDLKEETAFVAYLEMSLQGFLRVGMR